MSMTGKKPATSVTVDRVQKPFPAPVDATATVESIADATKQRDLLAVQHQLVRMFRENEYTFKLIQRYLNELSDAEQEAKMEAVMKDISQLLITIASAIPEDDLHPQPAAARLTNKHVVHVVPS